MHKGKIKKIIQDRGFGFISDTDGREVFFHRNGVLNDRFDSLREDQEVAFDVEQSPKGPRAINVTTGQIQDFQICGDLGEREKPKFNPKDNSVHLVKSRVGFLFM